MNYCLIMLLAIMTFSCSTFEEPANKKRFNKVVYNLNNKTDQINFTNWQKSNIPTVQTNPFNDTLFASNYWEVAHPFYQDSIYRVYSNCNGEFGGYLLFEKITSKGNYHYLSSTCPLMIDLQENGYYITSTLLHGNGHSNLSLVKDPSSLIKVDIENFYTKNRFYDSTRNGIDSLFLINRSNTEVLIDTFGLTINILYPLQNKLYLIYSADVENTFLGEVSNGKIQKLDTLLNKYIIGKNNLPNKIINGYYNYSYHRSYSSQENTRTTEGEIYIKKDSIIMTHKYTPK